MKPQYDYVSHKPQYILFMRHWFKVYVNVNGRPCMFYFHVTLRKLFCNKLKNLNIQKPKVYVQSYRLEFFSERCLDLRVWSSCWLCWHYNAEVWISASQNLPWQLWRLEREERGSCSGKFRHWLRQLKIDHSLKNEINKCLFHNYYIKPILQFQKIVFILSWYMY